MLPVKTTRRALALVGCATLMVGVAAAQQGQAPKQQPPQAPPAQAEHSNSPGKISWKASNQLHHNSGEFKNWNFTKVDIPGGNLEKGTVEAEIDITSLQANNPKLTAHLLTDDFFKSAKFPKATLKIHDAKKDAADPKKYAAKADLELLGVKGTLPVSFTVVSESPLKVVGEAKVDRTTFGVGAPFEAANKFSPEKEIAVTVEATLPSADKK